MKPDQLQRAFYGFAFKSAYHHKRGTAFQDLRQPMTVSRLWDEIREARAAYAPSSPMSYEWFVLALDLLFMMGAVDLDRGVLHRASS